MSKQGNQFTSPYPQNVLSERTLSLVSNSNGSFAVLNFFLTGNKIRVTEYTGKKDAKDNGVIKGDMSLVEAMTFFAALHDVIYMSKEEIEKIISSGEKYSQVFQTKKFVGKDKPRAIGLTFLYGRNKEGLPFITMQSNGMPTIPFFFNDDSIVLYNGKGEQIDKLQLHNSLAKGWIDTAQRVVPVLATVSYVDEETRKKLNSNRGGRDNGGGYSDSFSNDSSGDDDDDW